MRKKLIFLIMVFPIFFSCTTHSDVKEIRIFKDNEWRLKDLQTFTFDIKDTAASYNFNYLIRANISYPFYNLYLQQKLSDSSGAILAQTMDEIILFDEKTGKPYGDGAAEIYDYRISVPKLQNFHFNTPGKYKWIISHNMRPDPLVGVQAIGIEVIKNK